MEQTFWPTQCIPFQQPGQLLLFSSISWHRRAPGLSLLPLLSSALTSLLLLPSPTAEVVTWLLSTPSAAQSSLPNSRCTCLTDYSAILSEYLITSNNTLTCPQLNFWSFSAPPTAIPNSAVVQVCPSSQLAKHLQGISYFSLSIVSNRNSC